MRREFDVAILVRPDIDAASSDDGEEILSDVELGFVDQEWKFLK